MKKAVAILIGLMLCMLCACSYLSGDNGTDPDTGDDTQQITENVQGTDENAPDSGNDTETEQTSKPDESAQSAVSSNEKDLVGTWIVVCSTNYTGNPGDALDDMDSYFYMSEDEFDHSQIDIYEDGGALYADYYFSVYDWSSEGNHMPVSIEKVPLFDGCENAEWSAKITNPRTKETVIDLTLADQNRMIRYKNEVYEYDDEDPWCSVEVSTYLREGSADYENRDDLRYDDTVTVSNVQELLKSVKSNRKIILNEGVYNISEANERLRNPNITLNHGYASESGTIGSATIESVSNLCLETKNNAKVEICINDPYEPVLGFMDCDHITLSGITLGHHVEPGTCGGSVLDARNTSNLTVNDCHLYGCGAYGLDASDCSNIYFNNTEIYECTYGILYFGNVYTAEFTNCDMHDNMEYEMITLNSCGAITFKDCNFKNNTVKVDNYSDEFVQVGDNSFDILFENCDFRGNSYAKFTDGENVEMTQCSFKDQIVKKRREE